MNRLRDRFDEKYLRICLYAGVTVVLTVAAIMILSYSGPFWSTMWEMFKTVLKPVLTGTIICYMFLPFVEKIETLISKKETKWRRPAAVAIFYVALLIILVLVLVTVGFVVKGGLEGLGTLSLESIENYIYSLHDQFASEFGELEAKLREIKLPIGKAGDFVTGLINAISGFFSGLVFGIIFSIYFMLDGDNIIDFWKRIYLLLAGEKAMNMITELGRDANRAFSGYIRGQFIDALLVGVLSSIALFIAGVPYAVVIGVLIGIGNMIPYVGPIVGYVAVAVICLIMGQIDKLVIGIIIVAVLMFVDGNIINPRLLSDNIDVHPLLVISALLAGGAVGGLVGMLIAVPAAAFVKLQLDKYLDAREKALLEEENAVGEKEGAGDSAEESGKDSIDDIAEESDKELTEI